MVPSDPGSESRYYCDIAAFKAFRWLDEHAPALFAETEPEVWRKWIPAIISYPLVGSASPVAVQGRYVGLAYEKVPNEVLDWLSRRLAREGRRETPIIDRDLWSGLPAHAMQPLLLRLVRDEATNLWVVGYLLDELLEQGDVEARVFAVALVDQPLPAENARRERVLVAARTLLLHTNDAGWSTLWPRFQAGPEFGVAVIERAAGQLDRIGMAPFLDRIAEAEVADLYLWCERHIPIYQRPDGVHSVDTPQRVEWFREGIIRNLQHRGTPRALAEMDRLIAELPGSRDLICRRQQAEKLVVERAWVPVRPDDLARLVASRAGRLVDGADQLLDVIRESLERFQAKLQGETPLGFALWDEQVNGSQLPKGEERLSDMIKIHLEEDLIGRGIVLNREVQIRCGTSPERPGERTDIHVDAVANPGSPGELVRVKVIIEVKGCWNRKLKTAMKDQLYARYLVDNDCRHGLYAVGWFPHDQWDAQDYRRDNSPRDLDMLRDDLTTQAVGLSDAATRVEAIVLDCSRR